MTASRTLTLAVTTFTLALIVTACTGPKTAPTSSSSSDAVSPVSVSSQANYSASPATLDALSHIGSIEMGNIRAPLTLTLVTHPSCTYCRIHEEENLPQLKTDFIDKGLIRYQVLFLPIQKYQASSLLAASLSCARKKDKGFEMLSALFGLKIWNFTEDDVVTAGTIAGLAENDLRLCLASPPTQLIEAQSSILSQLKVSVVPTLLLGNERKVGLIRYADLRGWIEQKLAAVGK